MAGDEPQASPRPTMAKVSLAYLNSE